jgi:hypothetical protein
VTRLGTWARYFHLGPPAPPLYPTFSLGSMGLRGAHYISRLQRRMEAPLKDSLSRKGRYLLRRAVGILARSNPPLQLGDSSTASFQRGHDGQAAPWLILWLSAYNVFLLYSMGFVVVGFQSVYNLSLMSVAKTTWTGWHPLGS